MTNCRPPAVALAFRIARRARRLTARLTPAVVVAAALLLACPRAEAQLSDLDRSMLIDAMADEGMTELLLHFVEVEPPDDPVVARQVEIAQYRLQFDDTSLPREQRLAAFDRAVSTMQGKIEEFYDHEQRPVWQTDLAEMLLMPALQSIHQGAPFFYEFGVPTAEQREMVEQLAPQALEAVADADTTFFRLQTELPRDEDHMRRRVNTGLWTRMIDEYYQKRTQYYLVQAAYLVALLPEDHPYYTSLDEANPRMPMRQRSPEAERGRLLSDVIERAEPFLTTREAVIQQAAHSFTARALMRQGEYDAAEAAFTEAVQVADDSVTGLVTQLGLAELHALTEAYAQATESAVGLEEHAAARENPLYRLLVTDMQHRIRLAEAEQAPADQREAALAAAYEPYLELLDAPALGDAAEGLRLYVYQRWVDTFADERDDLASLSPVVLAGIAEAARREGQNLALEAREAGDATRMDDARTRLNLAIEAGRTLRESDAATYAPPAALALGMYNEAVAMYLLDPQGAGNLLGVAGLMTELAEEMPDQPVAEQAITNAVSLLRAVRGLERAPAEVDEAYRRAGDVLFREFPTSDTADSERVYFGYAMLYERGRFEEAAEMFGQVPYEHPQYFEAQAARAMALGRQVREMGEEERQAARQRAVDVATQVREEAEAEAAAASDAARREAAHLAAAEARLVLAQMALDAGDAGQALALLEGFEEAYAGEDVLVREAMEQRILALAEADRLDEAATVAGDMMERYRDDAAAVIDQVLNTIDEQIEQYSEELGAGTLSDRRRELEQRIQSLADTAVSLAEMLFAWAQDQSFADREMLGFELVRAKALRLAGEPGEAAAMLAPRMDAFGSNASLMHEYAEALFAQGTQASLAEAAAVYNRLIAGLQPPAPMWWNAWMRRLQISDRLRQNTDRIPLHVRQLRLRDETLGGRRFRETFESLEARHQR